jgi:hypothetical protein
MMFTIEFFRIREKDNAHAMPDRITNIASDLESAKVRAKSLSDTLNLPQTPRDASRRAANARPGEVKSWPQAHANVSACLATSRGAERLKCVTYTQRLLNKIPPPSIRLFISLSTIAAIAVMGLALVAR